MDIIQNHARIVIDPLTRLLAKVQKDPVTECWNFLSSIHRRAGHGRFTFEGRSRDAYVVAYNLLKGPVPSGKELHHECANRLCVNPAHLKPVTRQEHHTKLTPNHLAFKNARKTECPQGHPLAPGNLVKSHKGRLCLICARKYWREYRREYRRRLRASMPDAQ